MAKLTIEYENDKFNVFIDGEKLNFITSIYCSASRGNKSLNSNIANIEDIVNIVDVPEETVNLYKRTIELIGSVPTLQLGQSGMKVI